KGFKSFADVINLEFTNGINAIVGPNGSGKSNVVDAVRWVLGEQSVKSLRGEGSMSDVIFSGSKSRNPLNVATVELVFDNSDHYLNVPYTELSIKRRVYRSGENEYYLNNEKCRLKDITNLLMDTGMGRESFNIISQGEVDKILSNSSNDRRAIFEEASGIMKYKKRKEEALKKLDKTHNNIDRVNDIIKELELQIGPLKEQSSKAKEYLENKKGLDQYEVAILAYDIENIYQDLEQKKEKKEKIDQAILSLSTDTNLHDSKYLEDSNRIRKLEEEKQNLNRELIVVSGEKERIDGERNLLKEKSKSSKELEEIKEEIRKSLEQEEKCSERFQIIQEEIRQITLEKTTYEKEMMDIERELQNSKLKKNMLMNDYTSHNQETIGLEHKINSLKMEIEQGSDMPNSVRKILHNSSLTGIYNTIGNVIGVDLEYAKALNVAISSCKNFIITKDELSSKRAINYLKDNHLGRATFFPLDVIKERSIDYESYQILKNSNDFLGVLSDLVSYNQEFSSIIKNQLGIVIVSTNMDSATRLSHMIHAKYKIVTLDGDVVNVGGSLTGGSNYQGRSSILLKQEVNHLEEKYHNYELEEEEIEKEILDLNQELSKIEEKYFNCSRNKVSIEEKYDNKKKELEELKNEMIQLKRENEALQSIHNDSISEKEQELIRLFHEKSAYKEQLELRLESIEREISSLKGKMEEDEAIDRLKQSTLRNYEKESKELEIQINRFDVKLDQLLSTLNEEYEMTYEKARRDAVLDIEVEEARIKVNTYKSNIKRIGMVNLDSIEEFEKVNDRYLFLTTQKEDLENAENTLLEIMREMDGVMKEEFQVTFDQIKIEFQKVF
ncbi:MAG: AAA family ATPase, partial [Bacilli bacterium]|nr:AAA family ATPase [Bacilli bacterium]